MTLLPIELESQSPESPGVIDCDVVIVRAFWTPTHLNGSYKIKRSAFRAHECKYGTISCWRTEVQYGFSRELAIEKSREHVPPKGDEFFYSDPTAGIIRQVMYDEEEQIRTFAVIDDCSTDDQGGTDEMHCGVQRNPDIPWPNNLSEIEEKVQVAKYREMLIKAFEGFLNTPNEQPAK